jgi:hypothetical protein
MCKSEHPPSRFHRRQADAAGFRRADDRWEIEAHMLDVETRPTFHPVHGELPAGLPYQAFRIRLVVDDALQIDAIEAEITVSPPGGCNLTESVYAGLLGRRIGADVMREAHAMLGAGGCANLTELFGIAASTAMQIVTEAGNVAGHIAPRGVGRLMEPA